MIFLLQNHSRILFFCFVLFIFGNLGQTYFISWWNPHITEIYHVSQTTMGFTYATATFISSFFLPYLGKSLDNFRPLSFGVFACGGLSLGFIALALGKGVLGLFLGYFIIRLCGQMGLTLLATTTLSRKFGRHRGKALGLAQLGRALGEAMLPALAIFLLAQFGPQNAALIVGVGLFILMAPLLLGSGHSLDLHPLYPENDMIAKNNDEATDSQKFSSKQFYRDKHALLVVFSNTLIPFLATGLFFQQTSFAELKGWSGATMGMAFTLFGLVGLICTLLSGHLLDRFTATRLLPLPLIPMLLALAVLLWGQGNWACFCYLGFLAISAGMSGNIRNSFYGENFQLSHLGQIKGIDAGHMVRATALSPLLFSYAFDQNMPLYLMVAISGALTGIGILCYYKASRHYLDQHRKKAEKAGQLLTP